MNTLVLNCGSSSIKCSYYQNLNVPEWEAKIEWKNKFDSPRLLITQKGQPLPAQALSETDPLAALDALFNTLQLESIAVIGHRIVHGGKRSEASALVTDAVKKEIRECAELAPLHNLFELQGIEVMERRFPDAVQVAVFDTAFHHTLSDAARLYPIPYEWSKKGIVRFGFHGISFQYCANRVEELIGRKEKLLICHLGSGASLCAIKGGKSIDTTMGFTPLDGLMMDTRSGSIDPGILLYLLEKEKLKPKELSHALYHESGLLGVSGLSSDMRDLIERSEKKERRAELALELYLHRLNGSIGSMIASLQGVDAIVFTAGIGENAPLIRSAVAKHFSFLGWKLDETKQKLLDGHDHILSAADSTAAIVLIHTQEALEIARQCQKHL